MLHFIDFEVTKYDWLCVIINPFTNENTTIINDPKKLDAYYQKYKHEIFVGYNIRQYDQFIMKAILLGFDPKRVNDLLIINRKKGFEISPLFQKIPLMFYDVLTTMHSLKTLEAFMGHNIKETSVPFDIDRKLTEEELEDMANYCFNDVKETIVVFDKTFQEFEALSSLIKTFNLPLNYINKTKAQLSAIILNCSKKIRNDEWELYAVDTLKLSKYKHIMSWFMDKNNQSYEKSLTAEVAGIEHKFAWGGLHGAKTKYHGKGNIWHVDVESFYPAIMIEYDLLSRNVEDPKKYKQIRDTRIKLKAEKNPLQLPYKIVLNSTYGICKDKYSQAYDPRNANLVCVNGQLLLLDLIEKLEAIPSFELIQSNTDGLIIRVPEDQNETMVKVCEEWQKRTRMGLAFDEISEIWQKDVNNYIFKFKNGKYERKGAWAKENKELDFNLPILNLALFEYFTKGTPVTKTITECEELKMFQMVVKVSSKYKFAWHNGKMLTEKTHRVFASANDTDSYIGKLKEEGATIEKFANTPENCFIINDTIDGLTVKDAPQLDYIWYINEAKKRVGEFCTK